MAITKVYPLLGRKVMVDRKGLDRFNLSALDTSDCN